MVSVRSVPSCHAPPTPVSRILSFSGFEDSALRNGRDWVITVGSFKLSSIPDTRASTTKPEKPTKRLKKDTSTKKTTVFFALLAKYFCATSTPLSPMCPDFIPVYWLSFFFLKVMQVNLRANYKNSTPKNKGKFEIKYSKNENKIHSTEN